MRRGRPRGGGGGGGGKKTGRSSSAIEGVGSWSARARARARSTRATGRVQPVAEAEPLLAAPAALSPPAAYSFTAVPRPAATLARAWLSKPLAAAAPAAPEAEPTECGAVRSVPTGCMEEETPRGWRKHQRVMLCWVRSCDCVLPDTALPRAHVRTCGVIWWLRYGISAFKVLFSMPALFHSHTRRLW